MAATQKTYQCIQNMFDPTKPSTCELYKTCKTPYMKMSGDLDSEILIIGEGPGADEDLQGKPFVGDSGKLLKHALDLAGVKKYALTNAVRCRPPGNRDPKTSELHSCHSFLEEDFNNLPNLKLIVLVGNHAMLSVLGYKGILEYSGTYRTLTIGPKQVGVLCVMHPSHVLQNQNQLKVFISHIARIPNALTGSIVDPNDLGVYWTMHNIDRWNQYVEVLEDGIHNTIVYDLETNSLDPYRPDSLITCISVSHMPRVAYAIDPTDPEFFLQFIGSFKRIMENPRIHKVGQNIKFDNLWLKVKWGIEVKGTVWSTDISQYLLDEHESHGLKSMAWKYTKLGGYESLVQNEPHLATGQNLFTYGCMDADITYRIYEIHKPLIEADPKLERLNRELLVPVIDVLRDMEEVGIRIDPDKLKECETNVDNQMDKLSRDIMQVPSVIQFQKDSGLTFNPRSAPQLREVLFKYEGLKSTKKTEKAKLPSTDRSVLEANRLVSKVCDILCEHSLYSNMKSKMIANINDFQVDNRIHTHFWVTETATGRSSSDDPPMQNVTKGKKDVVGIRKVFLADDGYDLLEADYNQHELRCMADIAEDEALYKAIQSGDVHTATAASILLKDPKLITDDERRDIGKTFNFGFIYGLTKYGIVKRLGCTERRAQDYLDRFFQIYYKTKLFMDATTLFVKENGYVKSRTGRYRRFPIWNELDDKSIREAINMPVQALAGDILLYSLIAIRNFLKEINAKSFLCLEVHDSLILNLHKEEHSILPEIKRIMLNDFRKLIPFTYDLDVDMKIGPNWGEMEKI